MILSDFHMHTTYCDGENSPEEMVLAAIEKGMTDVGLTVHSYTFFDETYCITKENVEKYVGEIAALKKKYADKIRVRCGVEQDYYSDYPTDMFDYVIGSVHYLKKGGKYFSLDSKSEWVADLVRDCYGGDFYLLAEEYFETLAGVVKKTGADIIGHFDLITKYVEKESFFDITNERYLAAAKKAVDRLIPYGKPFEINTGAIARGLRSHPYPSAEIISYIKEKGGKLILSSDCHSKENLMFQFDKWEYLLK